MASMEDRMARQGPAQGTDRLPPWVPASAQVYLAHTEAGWPIRAIARAQGCHASTILRQIRRIEQRRDDPLVDAALRSLGAVHFTPPRTQTGAAKNEAEIMSFHKKITAPSTQNAGPDEATLIAEARRILRRLCEKGSVLAVAADMEKAVIVRDGAGGVATRTGVVDRQIAEAMALKEWITPQVSGRITRYSITAAGRTALEGLLRDEDARQPAGFAESQQDFALESWADDDEAEVRPSRRRMRYNLAESPLTALARRRDKDGSAFLSDELVRVGEQLREDFELSQMGPRVTQNWDRFLTGGGREPYVPDGGGNDATGNARQRVADALADLGPGLADVALRCCCYLEGLETCEKKLGWSARSGKIVLRIALQRLKRHYDDTVGPGGPLIG
jgi:hypothetical protein